jgi:cell division septum initiation protein DivIVA
VSSLDEQGLDLFDETATAAGNFPHAIRGYERSAVDAYIRELESKLSKAMTETRETRHRLELLAATADTTDYSRLGGHARGLLTAAEAQAAEIVAQAQAHAATLRSETGTETTRLSHETQRLLDESRAATTADLEQLRTLLGEQTAAELEAARADAAALLEATERQREWLIREAETQARTIVDAALAEAEQRRAETERLAAEQASELARAKEAALSEIAAGRQAAADQIAELLAVNKQEADEQRTRLEADLATADQRREAARAEAAEIARGAAEQAQVTIANAQHEAARILSEANQAAIEQAEQVRLEVEALDLRKQSIVAQLAQLSGLALDTVEQTAPAPAASEPSPAAARSDDADEADESEDADDTDEDAQVSAKAARES